MIRRFLVPLMMIAMVAQPLVAAAETSLDVPLLGKRSLVRLGAIPNPVTETGLALGQQLFDALDKQDPALMAQTIPQLDKLGKEETVGGASSAMKWLVNAWLQAREAGSNAAPARPALEQAFYDYFLADNGKNLKEYLQRKYRAANFKPTDDPEKHLKRGTFLEDMLMFNNPARAQWEPTDQVLEVIGGFKSEVHKVIDLGAGFGYFSEKIANTLGPDATVYAADTEESYVEQLREFIKTYQIKGIQPLVSKSDDISVPQKTDMVFIASLYHVLYTWSLPQQRDAFMKTLNTTLRPGGYLVVLDNRDNDGVSLHNSFLDKDLAIAQLYFYGFELVKSEDLSPYRYVLVFRKSAPDAPKPPSYANAAGASAITVSNTSSVVHIGSLDSFDITPAGIAAAKLMMKAVTDSDPVSARAAIEAYDKLIPNENFGGEYTALQWVAQYIAGSDQEKQELTKDPLAAEFLAYLSKDDYKTLKSYLARKYKLEAPKITVEEATDEKTREIGIVRRQSLEDFILFNNPRRESWEKSSRIMELLPIKPGDTIVDIGSGPGFYSFKFADRVGPQGKVYAFDTKEVHIEYIKELVKKWGLSNLVATASKENGFQIPEPGTADMVYMCSLYHILYAVMSQSERDGMIDGIVKALKPGGKFVVVDNGPVVEGKLPYHGPYIRQELITTQLAAYGFKLESSEQIIPQRYLMVFTH